MVYFGCYRVCTDLHGAWKEGEHEVCGQSLQGMGDRIWVWPNLHIKLSGELLFDGWMESGVGFELGKATHGVLCCQAHVKDRR